MFKKTRLRLTLQYTAVLLALFAMFSSGIYLYMKYTFQEKYVQETSQISDLTLQKRLDIADAADAGIDRLRNGLVVSSALLFVIIPLISAFLARRALQPIEASYNRQNRFVDDASHELRTPLSVIQGELELALQRDRPKAAYVAAMTLSLQEVHRITRLINELLLLARSNRRQLVSSFTPISCGKLVECCVVAATQNLPKRKIIITTNDPANLLGSEQLLERALLNVIENALKFSTTKDPVRITVKNSLESVVISVADTGIGMTPDELPRAFDRFWRAEESRTVSGFGLGLPLVKQIITLHGGSVELQSKLGTGTTVVIKLPRRLSA